MFHQGIFRLGQDADECFFIQLGQCGNNRQTADQLGNQAEFNQIFRLDNFKQLSNIGIFVFAVHRSAKADTALFRTLADNLFQAGKGATADKQDICGIYLNKILIRVLAPALRRYGCHRAFNQFQQSLLHALAGHIAGNRGIVALTGNLVDFININNPLLRLFHIEIAVTQELGNNLFHVFAHIAGLS